MWWLCLDHVCLREYQMCFEHVCPQLPHTAKQKQAAGPRNAAATGEGEEEDSGHTHSDYCLVGKKAGKWMHHGWSDRICVDHCLQCCTFKNCEKHRIRCHGLAHQLQMCCSASKHLCTVHKLFIFLCCCQCNNICFKHQSMFQLFVSNSTVQSQYSCQIGFVCCKQAEGCDPGILPVIISN